MSERRKRRLQALKNDLYYYVLKVLFFLLRLIPFSPSVRLGAFLGRITYLIDLPGVRRIVRANLMQAFDDSKTTEEFDRIGLKCFESLGAGLLEMVNFGKIRANYRDYISSHGFEHVRRMLDEGKGALMISGHCGNWELMASYASLEGFPVNVVARSVYDSRINDLLNEFRESNGIRVLHRDHLPAMRELIRALKANQIIGMLIDQDTRVPSVFVDFFGKAASTPVGAAQIARKYGCPVFTSFCMRRPEGGLHIEVSEPLDLVKTDDLQADLIENTGRLTAAIEDHVRKHPEEWVWMHRRWRRRPPGETRAA